MPASPAAQNPSIESETAVRLRPGAAADGPALFRIFKYALTDLVHRLGISDTNDAPDEAEIAEGWATMRAVYDHLAETAAHFWVAERGEEIVGFARATDRDGVRELTDFFVHPGAQSGGVGRALLAQTFPAAGARRRCILATPDLRAQARYLKSGVYPRFPIYSFRRAPQETAVDTDLRVQPITATAEALAALAALDRQILDYRRDADHRWLLQDRRGYLYLRHGRPVGYGYEGAQSGPFAMLHRRDLPAALAHAETAAAQNGREEFAVNVPMVNQTAVDYLLQRGFQLGAFFCYFMSDAPFGKFDRYVNTTPMLFL